MADERPTETKADYTRKTYRYLRIAIVGMVLALIIGLVAERLDAGSLLGSISAYYYTSVNPLFVGSLVMIGICMIAIRGISDFEDIALNVAGMLAPVVALVPTAYPADRASGYGGYLFDLDTPNLIRNGVPSLAGGAVAAVVITLALANRLRRQPLKPQVFTPSTWIGFAVAVATVVGLGVVYRVWGQRATHNLAASAMFVALWAVATENVVRAALRRSERTRSETRSRRYGWVVGIGGALTSLGAALTLAGAWRLAAGEGDAVWWLVAAGVAVALVLFWPGLSQGAARYLDAFWSDRWRTRWYAMIAAWMLFAGVILTRAPVEWDHRTYFIELAELLPFGLFWLVQTIENWDAPAAEHFTYSTAPEPPEPAEPADPRR